MRRYRRWMLATLCATTLCLFVLYRSYGSPHVADDHVQHLQPHDNNDLGGDDGNQRANQQRFSQIRPQAVPSEPLLPSELPASLPSPARAAGWASRLFEPYLMVLGMHRSLTSAVVQALAETMNFRLGSDRLTQHWELQQVADLNEGILLDTVSTWQNIQTSLVQQIEASSGTARGSRERCTPPPAYCRPRALHRIAALLVNLTSGDGGDGGEHGPLVIKDPRLCVTLGCWSCAPMRPPPHVVLIFRSPIEVARSLQARNRLPLAQGIKLWYQYNRLALDGLASNALNYTIIDSHDLLEQPLMVLKFLHSVFVHRWHMPRVQMPLDGGALDAKLTSSPRPTDRTDLEQQIDQALQLYLQQQQLKPKQEHVRQPLLPSTQEVMGLYDALILRRYEYSTVPE